jgi:hypothetical protein
MPQDEVTRPQVEIAVIHLAGAKPAQPESRRSGEIAARCLALKFPKIVVRV